MSLFRTKNINEEQDAKVNMFLKDRLPWSYANRLTTNGWSTQPSKHYELPYFGYTKDEIASLLIDIIQQFLDSVNACMLYRVKIHVAVKEERIFVYFQPVGAANVKLINVSVKSEVSS